MEDQSGAAQHATSRTVTRFAWHPLRLSDGRWIHLRWYDAIEELEPDYGGWSTGHWIVVERRRRG